MLIQSKTKGFFLCLFFICLQWNLAYARPTNLSRAMDTPVLDYSRPSAQTSNEAGLVRRVRHIHFGGFLGGLSTSPLYTSVPLVSTVPVISTFPVVSTLPVVSSVSTVQTLPSYGLRSGYGGGYGYGGYEYKTFGAGGGIFG